MFINLRIFVLVFIYGLFSKYLKYKKAARDSIQNEYWASTNEAEYFKYRDEGREESVILSSYERVVIYRYQARVEACKISFFREEFLNGARAKHAARVLKRGY